MLLVKRNKNTFDLKDLKSLPRTQIFKSHYLSNLVVQPFDNLNLDYFIQQNSYFEIPKDYFLSPNLLSTHLQSASFTVSLTCYLLICYEFTCYLFHLLSASLVLRPHLHSGLTCSRHTSYSASLASRLICYQASLAIPLFAINSLAICFTCSRPFLYSGLSCSRHTWYPASLAIRSISYQASLAIKTFVLQSQLLSMRICYTKRVYTIEIPCYQNQMFPK